MTFFGGRGGISLFTHCTKEKKYYMFMVVNYSGLFRQALASFLIGTGSRVQTATSQFMRCFPKGRFQTSLVCSSQRSSIALD